jgi:hypothetical protein
VPCDDRQPCAAGSRGEPESADHPLTAFMVTVEQVNRDRLRCGSGIPGHRIQRLIGIAKRPLPEARVAGGYVNVASQPAEFLAVRRIGAGQPLRGEVPAMEHRDTGSGVAEPDDQVDRVGPHLERRAAALDLHPVLVVKRHLLRWVLETRGHEHRAQSGEQRRSAARAARLAERTEEKVATARTSVPPAVASAEMVTQSAMTPELSFPVPGALHAPSARPLAR